MSIYRAYDIRGVYGKDLTDDVAVDVGRALGSVVGGECFAVGGDNRLSSPSLRESISEGLNSAGVDVIDVGTVPTPLLYFAIRHYETDGGVMVTGSHNPPEYNGLKMCRGTATFYGEEIQELRKTVESKSFKTGSGSKTERGIVNDYIDYIKENIKLERPLKVVVDAGNGTASEIAPRLYRELGCEVVELYCEMDGTFPNHHPDPTVDENLVDLIARVRETGADLGVGFDGDGDRAGFVDDQGSIVRGDQALILYSRDVLENRPGSSIIFEVKCSQALIDGIKEYGGNPIMYRTGHSFIKKKMKEIDSPLAGEMSGHFFFADKYFGFDDGIYAGARMIELLSKSDRKLSELIGELPKYHTTPELRLECPEEAKFRIVDEVKKSFQSQGYEVVTVDGARIQFPGGWGLVRASNTTPVLILRFEAKTPEELEEIKAKVKTELSKYPELKDKLDQIF